MAPAPTPTPRLAAKTIAGSNLVKSAVYGADPNWGRLMMALGRSGAEAIEEKVDLFVNGVCIMEAGLPVPFHRDAVVALMSGEQVDFRVSLNLADCAATAYGCDPHRTVCPSSTAPTPPSPEPRRRWQR